MIPIKQRYIIYLLMNIVSNIIIIFTIKGKVNEKKYPNIFK